MPRYKKRSNPITNCADMDDLDYGCCHITDMDWRLSSARRTDFSGAVLLEINARRADFGGACFIGAELVNVDFSGSNLDGANFTGASLVNVDFTHTSLVGAIFLGATLNGVTFYGADVDSIDMTGSEEHDVSWEGVTTTIHAAEAEPAMLFALPTGRDPSNSFKQEPMIVSFGDKPNPRHN